jgi:serine/threonine protein kinase
MGVVYKAQHLHISRTIALKMLLRDAATNPMEFKRFRQEAETASQLRHPNIIAIYDFGPVGEDQFYLAMDYLDGKTLYQAIKTDGPLSIARFQTIFQQACDALEHAHKNKVVHRDIKPGNFVLTERNGQKDFVVIVDFGLVKLLTQNEDQHLTTTGAVLGSPLYMSPEQCRGLALDQRTDIYSLGCVMYESLCGKPPLSGPTVIDTITKHLHEPPAPFKEVNPGIYVPPEVEAVIMKALAKDPADRHQSMAELGQELTKALSGAPTQVRASYAGLIKPSKQTEGNVQPPQTSYARLTAEELAAQALSNQGLPLSTRRSSTNYRMLGWLISLAIGCVMTVIVVGSLVVATNEMSKKAKLVSQRNRAMGLVGSQRSVNAFDTVSNTVTGRGTTNTASDPPSDGERRLEIVERDANAAYDSANWPEAMAYLKESIGLRIQMVGPDSETLVPYLAKIAVAADKVHDPNAADYLRQFQDLSSRHPDVIMADYGLLLRLTDPIVDFGNQDDMNKYEQLLDSAAQQASDQKAAMLLNMNRGLVLGKLGRSAEAVQLLKKCVDDSESYPEIHDRASSILSDLSSH